MGWGSNYRNSGIVRLFNYEQALAHFHAVKPIRGREVECRPLGHRDRSHFSIGHADNGDVLCFDYNNSKPSVTFKPNGEVLITPAWISTSTVAFIYEVTGVYSKVFDHSIILSLGSGQYRVPEGGVTLKRGDKDQYTATNEIPAFVHSIERREANNVRSKYLEYKNYLVGVMRLRGDDDHITSEELKEFFGVEIQTYTSAGTTHEYERINTPDMDTSNPDSVAKLIGWMKSEEPTDKYKCALALIKSATGYRRTADKPVLDLFDRFILAHHKDTVFKKKPLEQGCVRKDRYSWAFR